jgi:integrase
MALIWDDIDFIKGTVHVERACKWIKGVFTEIGPPKSERGHRFIELAPELLELLKIHFEKQQERIKEFNRAGIAYGGDAVKKWLTTCRPDQAHHYRNINLIFPNHSGVVENSSVHRQQFKAMLRKAGITRKLRWYDLRHTHATFLLIMGIPEFEVADRMGHRVEQLRETYSHMLEGRQRKASKMFASIVPVVCAQPEATDEVKTLVFEYVGNTRGHLLDFLLGTQGKKDVVTN